jgi:hypothetical protein
MQTIIKWDLQLFIETQVQYSVIRTVPLLFSLTAVHVYFGHHSYTVSFQE